MNRSPLTPTPRLEPKPYGLALMLGLMLGQAVAFMAQRRPDDMLSFAMAIVLVISASASFVLYMLATRTPHRAKPKARPSVHGWLGAIAGGLLLSFQAQQFFL